ncbi:hypothetical protein ABZ348_12895 [Streptomyces sp. NPDC005963]|uniref:hypothetical protein n=1 Tax=Streptomyces sp. NPDC005963 TaxID=3156721 RepID=UPI0033F589E9
MNEALDDPVDLSGLPPRRPNWQNTAVIGGIHEDDFDIALGYLQAADILASHWIRSGTNDALPVPIYNNYRHSIELSLKACIRLAANCLRCNGVDLSSDEPDKLVNASHAIGHLADRLNQYLGRLLEAPNNRIPEKTQETLDWLHQLDENGQTFRYSTVKGGKGKGVAQARPNQQTIDFDADCRRLHDAGWMLYSAVGGYLDNHAALQAEYYAEMAPDAAW